jgi:hypothetical protein
MDITDTTSDSLKDRIGTIVSLVGLYTGLIYWTGRWYKEWYFAQFGIPYEILTFDLHYYLFGSWATILVALSFIIIAITIPLIISPERVINVLTKLNEVKPFWQVVAVLVIMVLLLSCLGIWFLYVPIRFNPSSTFLGKLLRSKDILVMAFGGVCSIIATIRLVYLNQKLLSIYKAFAIELRKHTLLIISASFIGVWVYLVCVGYLMGVYHGKAALYEGKMGSRWVRIKDGGAADQWWILVTRTNDGRIFLFDKKTNKVRLVKDDAIQEIDVPIMEKPKAIEAQ